MPKAAQNNDSRVFDKTIVTLLAAGFAAVGLTGLIVNVMPSKVATPEQSQAVATSTVSPGGAAGKTANVVWATTAPGRVEPKGGNVQVRPEASGRITHLHAATGDVLNQHDLIARLRDDDTAARLEQAVAEVAVRLGERDEEPEENQLVIERRKASDELAAAERAVFAAWRAFDKAYLAARSSDGQEDDVSAARAAIKQAQDAVAVKAKALAEIRAKADMPLPTRLDSGLALARGDLTLAEIAYNNTRVRMPADATLLRLDAKIGEMASSSQRTPFAVVGDMTSTQVTAEVQERDVSKVRVGQGVIVRSNAFADMEFEGKVVEVAPMVGSPGLRALGPRQQLDAEVLEVKIELAGKPPVMPGMRVDVFFKAEQRVSAVMQK